MESQPLSPEHDTGRYRLQDRLTPDGNAWRAEDLEDPTRPVVLKFLPEGADAIAARHVVENLAALEGRGLGVPTDEGETPDGRPYLVYPWVEGQTLREMMNETGTPGFARTARLLRQMGDALSALHARGIVHGSVTPEHIVIRQAHGHEVATILHAGVYRVARESSASPAYLAPEQLSGDATPASDLFSVAAVAAEMLTGRRVFRYASLAELEHLHRRGVQRGAFRKLRPRLPLRVEDELRRALSWDPSHRPSDVQILTTRLAESLGGNRALPKRRLFLLALLALAMITVGIRNCRRRWGM